MAGNAATVNQILSENPDINVNWQNDYGATPLHIACVYGRSAIVAILLAHPNVKVNLKSRHGSTPFNVACRNMKLPCVRLLLKDSRVTLLTTDKDHMDALTTALQFGHIDVLRWWIASGREIHLDPRHEQVRVAREDIVALLARFTEDPEETCWAVRREISWHSKDAAEVFALVVFASDGFLEFRKGRRPTPPPPGSSELLANFPWSYKWCCATVSWCGRMKVFGAGIARPPSEISQSFGNKNQSGLEKFQAPGPTRLPRRGSGCFERKKSTSFFWTFRTHGY